MAHNTDCFMTYRSRRSARDYVNFESHSSSRVFSRVYWNCHQYQPLHQISNIQSFKLLKLVIMRLKLVDWIYSRRVPRIRTFDPFLKMLKQFGKNEELTRRKKIRRNQLIAMTIEILWINRRQENRWKREINFNTFNFRSTEFYIPVELSKSGYFQGPLVSNRSCPLLNLEDMSPF